MLPLGLRGVGLLNRPRTQNISLTILQYVEQSQRNNFEIRDLVEDGDNGQVELGVGLGPIKNWARRNKMEHVTLKATTALNVKTTLTTPPRPLLTLQVQANS